VSKKATSEIVASEATFTKEQILHSKKYAHVTDRVNAVLKDDQTYTLDQVEDLIQEFMKVEVK